MDEYHCNAYPKITPTTFLTKTIPPCPNHQCFIVEIEYTNMYVINARKFDTCCDTTNHIFSNISKDSMMQETTIVSWLSYMDVPKDAFNLVVAKILQCASDMVSRRNKNEEVLSMQVDLVVTRANEDEDDESEEEEEDEDEDDESEEEEEDDNEDIDEDEEEEEQEEDDMEEDHAAMSSSIEGLDIVRVEEKGMCAICFEDFNVGVCLPCFHMFHTNCIQDWLRIKSSCPLCRLQIPTKKSE